MSIAIETTDKIEDPAKFIASSVLKNLKERKRVLLFLAGGSSVAVGVKLSEILRGHSHQNLTVTLTDERYGPIDHFNSNFFQLNEKGFSLPEAKVISVLVDDDMNITTEKFDKALERALKKADYKIGLFGIGTDGHTAGILPDSAALNSDKFAFGYVTPIFSRITITPKVIEMLDEAVVFAQGKDKWGVIENLEKDIEIAKQPAQLLKKVPVLTVFTDYRP